MTGRPTADRLLQHAALAGYGVAAAAGALTVGLVAGVTHSSQAATSATTGTSGTSGSSQTFGTSDDGTTDDGGQQFPQGGLGVAPQGSMPQGGSHGS